MILFDRYPHINELVQHYSSVLNREDIKKIIETGISSEQDASIFAMFIWDMVEKINNDEENGITVLGSTDNTEMFPDLNYEVTKYMKQVGFYSVWERISAQKM